MTVVNILVLPDSWTTLTDNDVIQRLHVDHAINRCMTCSVDGTQVFHNVSGDLRHVPVSGLTG